MCVKYIYIYVCVCVFITHAEYRITPGVKLNKMPLLVTFTSNKFYQFHHGHYCEHKTLYELDICRCIIKKLLFRIYHK